MDRSATGPVFEAAGSLVLFGHETRTATVSLFERARGWRIRRAALFVLAGLVIAPVVVLFPPHIPWLLGALGGSGFLAWRTMSGRFAIVAVEGACPRCQVPIQIPAGTRLRVPHPLSCGGCHHDFVLKVDLDPPHRD
jgi:hypothetical protein